MTLWKYLSWYIPQWTGSEPINKIYKVVGIGDFVISNNVKDTIKTFALASCVAVTAYSPAHKVLGMVHIALPDSKVNPESAGIKPGYFADTAIPALFNEICASTGARWNELVVNLFGGANSINLQDVFVIGKRNLSTVVSILEDNMVPFTQVATGGTVSRTVEVDVANGAARVEVLPIMI